MCTTSNARCIASLFSKAWLSSCASDSRKKSHVFLDALGESARAVNQERPDAVSRVVTAGGDRAENASGTRKNTGSHATCARHVRLPRERME